MKSKMSWLLLATVTVMVGFSSCDNNDDDGPTGPDNIAGIVANNPSFSILNNAINRAGLGSALSGGALTVFAPDNAAFEASGITNATVNALPVASLDSILKYHVLGSTVSSGGVPVSDAVSTLLGTKLFASRNTNGVFANGIKVKTADVPAANGVIHVIERVLIPPTKTIAQIVSADTSFSILLAAVVKAGLDDELSQPGKYTVFAPTNAAFRAAGFANAAAINAANTTVITNVVKQHVLTTNVFAGDLTEGATPTTLQANTLTVNLNPVRVKVTGSASASSNVTTANVVATNGVIHIIDRVLQ
ncbi:MAG: fasciclin domain-containing protein [Sphingobacteriales bacterium]|jgi:uncharacterized surface protein with fasciclin (FAS1) repeats